MHHITHDPIYNTVERDDFRALIEVGIIAERTRATYAAWVDMDELEREDDQVVGTDVAEAGIASLREINRGRSKMGAARRRGA